MRYTLENKLGCNDIVIDSLNYFFKYKSDDILNYIEKGVEKQYLIIESIHPKSDILFVFEIISINYDVYHLNYNGSVG